MKKELLKYMCCPDCREDLVLSIKKENDKEIISGTLSCRRCKKEYPVIEGVPVVLDSKKLKHFSKTKKNWENWWKKVRDKSDVELYDRLWKQALKNIKGEPLYKKEDFTGKVVLDAGCGIGRHIESDFSKYECKEIIGVDLGMQIFEAKKTNRGPHMHFVQADLTRLPFKKEIFDVIVSDGVLHHTPKPKQSFLQLSKHLKKNGMMAIYVYHKEWSYFKAHKKSLLLDFLYSGGVLIWQGIRWIVSRMPHQIILCFANLMAVKSTVENALERNAITKPLGKLSRLIPPFAYIGVNFHERVVRNYDHYSATYNYFQSIDEVVDWFRSGNFDNLEITSVPISIRGIKQDRPAEPLTIKDYELVEHFKFRKEWERLYQRELKARI